MIRGSNLESSSNLSLNDFKVEESLKGSLDSILSPSPSVQIQIMGGKVCLRRKGKTLLGIVNKHLPADTFRQTLDEGSPP